MTDTTQTDDDVSADDKARTLKTVLQAQSNEYGDVPEDAWVTITVSYENRQGNLSVKHGDAWRASDNRINFSANAGDDDEDAYFLKFTGYGIRLISVSEAGTHTELGEVSNLVIEQ
jgi:hypothetical protein